MKYLILECTENDAIALDDEGRFLRVINNDYQVGQKVERVTLSLTNSRRPSRIVYFVRSLSAVAASLILAFYYLVALRPVSTINLAINPEVTIKFGTKSSPPGRKSRCGKYNCIIHRGKISIRWFWICQRIDQTGFPI